MGVKFSKRTAAVVCAMLLVWLVAPAAQAADWDCPSEPALVRVSPIVGKTQIHHNKTIKDLTYMQKSKGAAVRDGHHVNGLGGGKIGLEGTASFTIIQRGKKACIWLKELNARFFAYPDMHIAKNFPKNTCEYDAVFEHEMKHVNVLKDFHKEYGKVFKRELELIAKRIKARGPMSISHIQSAQRRMNRKIDRDIQSFNDRILKVLERRQHAVDTPEEYKRVSAQCKNWRKYY